VKIGGQPHIGPRDAGPVDSSKQVRLGQDGQTHTQGPARRPDLGDHFVGKRAPVSEIPLRGFIVRIPNATNLLALMDLLLQHLGQTPPEEQLAQAMITAENLGDIDGILNFARDLGLQAEAFNHSNLEEVKAFIHKEIPVLALTKAPEGAPEQKGHWIIVRGENSEINLQEGKVDKFLLIEDPSGQLGERVSEEQFLQAWKGFQLFGVPSGYDNLIVALGALGAEIQRSRLENRVAPTRATLHGLAGMQSGLKKFKEQAWFAALGDLVGGSIEFTGGFVGLKLLHWGERLRSIADKIRRWYKDLLAVGGWIAALPAAGGMIAFAAVAGAGALLSGTGIAIASACALAGRLVRHVSTSIQNGLNRLVRWFKR
jgi:hypothetical protein